MLVGLCVVHYVLSGEFPYERSGWARPLVAWTGDAEAKRRELEERKRQTDPVLYGMHDFETEELVLEFNPSWTMAGWTGIFSERIDELIRGGFKMVEQFCYHHDEQFSHARWRGRMRTCSGVGSGNLSPAEVQRFDAALGDLLRRKYPDPMVVEYRVWCVVVRKPT